ncbi:Regulator of chromosome condensation (RCC1) repeat protein [compost metagenome]
MTAGISEVSSVASGSNFTATLKSDGTVWSWGNNASGQLGNNTLTSSLTPVQATGMDSVLQIAAGKEHVVALKSDGTVWSWGLNGNGQLGNGSTVTQKSAVQISSLSGVISVAAGDTHSLAIKGDGSVWAWGYNFGNSPRQINGLTNVVSIAGGNSLSSVAVKSDGTVWSISNTGVVTPVSGLNQVVKAVTSGGHSLALKADGSVWSWGNNHYGQLGDGSLSNRSTPVQVIGLNDVVSIAVGSDGHSVAMKSDGSVWSWGYNHYGQLGDGSLSNRSQPVQMLVNTAPEVSLSWPLGTKDAPAPSNVTKPLITWNVTDGAGTTFTTLQVQILDASSTVVLDSGEVEVVTQSTSQSWQVNAALPENQNLQVRVKVKDGVLWSEWSEAGWMKVEQGSGGQGVSANNGITLVVKSDGTVQGMGLNSSGQLGNGLTYNSSTAMTAGISEVSSVASGSNFTATLKSDGTVWSWGNNASGQLGNNTLTSSLTPVQATGMDSVLQIAAGKEHVVALKSDGTVWSWGLNGNGQLGNGSTVTQKSAVQISSLSGVISVAAGDTHSLAIKGDGSVWAWGYNFGNSPRQINGLTNVVSIAGGNSLSSVAVKSDGTVWSISNTGVVTPVSGLNQVVKAVTSGGHSLALKADGSVWSWGNNHYGQLGDGSLSNRSTPVQVIGLNDVVSIAVGSDGHSVAMKSDGSVWSWGYNHYGQLGDGSLSNRSQPVQMLVNTAPEVSLSWPLGTKDAPAPSNVTKPLITWNVTDGAGTTFTTIQVQIQDASGTVILNSSEVNLVTQSTSQSWQVGTQLPTFQKLKVRVKVKDGALWSEWSDFGWFIIQN